MENKYNIKRKQLVDRKMPSSEQIAKYQNFNKIKGDYSLIKKIALKNTFIWTGGIFTAVAISVITYLSLTNSSDVKEKITEKESNVSIEKTTFIQKPLKNTDVEFGTYKISALSGGIINHPSGSIITIPASAFIDSKGNGVTDSVEIKYREFHNKADIFLSGIPMKYDSAGTKYTLESAGMIEVLAYKDNEPVQLKNNSTIDIKMVSNNDESRFNLYYLDSVKNNWTCIGKDKIEKKDAPIISSQIPNKTQEITKSNLIKPALADAKKYSFTITYKKEDFPELAAYDNVKFEVADNNFKSSYYKINWENISVYSTNTEGNYLIKLKKADTTINVNAIPVFDKKNYEKALNEFENKHQKNTQERDEKNLEKIQQLNDVNKSLKSYNRKEMMNSATAMNRARNNVYRVFGVARLGIYNCDFPVPPAPEIIYVTNIQKQLNGDNSKEINYNTIFIAEKGKNTVFKFSKNEQIRIDSKKENLIWTITDKGDIAFFRNIDFKKLTTTKADLKPVVALNQEKALEEIKNFEM